jgi:hypothetical protein
VIHTNSVPWRPAAISTSATSGRLNSTGGRSPLNSRSRTAVPDRLMMSPSIFGYDLLRDHPAVRLAVAGVLELQDAHAEVGDEIDLVEDLLRVVGAVVGADAGVVAPDDEVGARRSSSA